jgi:glyoxylase-like metal-dependent hydrolase (beta-lactamase superfamily II)
MDVVKIDENVHVIIGKNSGKFPYCNVLLVDNFLIDAGAGIEIIQELVKRANCLILSHTHPDHASGAWIFNEASKAVLAPPDVSTDLDSLAVRFVGKKLAEIWKSSVTSFLGMKSFQSERFYEGILTQSPEIEAISAPGHTADHHVFLINGNVLFAADIDLSSFGPFYGNPESDPWLFKKSVERVLELDLKIFVPAHSMPVFGREDIERRVQEYLEIFDRRDEILLDLLEQPRNLEELVEISPVYGKKPFDKEILDFFERNMIEKHLRRLIEKGKVKIKDNRYCRT